MSKKKRRRDRRAPSAPLPAAAAAQASSDRGPIARYGRWVAAAAIVVAVAAAIGFAMRGGRGDKAPPSPSASLPAPQYVGAQACAACHAQQYESWRGSHHAQAMLEPNAQTVRGDFSGAKFSYAGVTSAFFKRDEKFYVRTDGPDGKLADYEIKYTFGITPLQQYLIEFPGGRLQALSIAWDTRDKAAGGQRWFHLYPKERIDHRDVLHWTGQAQSWNYMCADCHSTDLKLNYRLAEDRFAPTWSDIAVACEACHGPGSRHVAWAERAKSGQPIADPLHGLTFALKDASGSRWNFAPGESIARRTQPLASRAELETCGACHARRAPIASEHRPGAPLEQNYRVALLDQTLYHADGQIQDEVYEYGSFVQSKMHQAGVTCSDCHDSHSAGLRQPGNALCAQCHLPAKYDGPQHHFHKGSAETAQSAQCVSCHMPERFYMVVDGRRDHSLRVPRPDLSAKLGTPNACNQCHRDKPAQWAAQAVAKWYGPNRRSGWHWAEAIDAGRRWQFDAERQLVRAIGDAATPAIARASALSLLPPFLSPGSLRTLETSLHDVDPLVRRAAATALPALDPPRRVALGAPLLGDPIRSVRFQALTSLLGTPSNEFASQQRSQLDQVAEEYRAAQLALADRAESHLNLGVLDANVGKLDAAEAAYRTAIRLQPRFTAAYINLADLYREQGREEKVVETLQEALRRDPNSAEAIEAMGLSLVRQKRLRDALPQLAKAAQLREDAPRYAYVYAIALHESGEKRRALQVLERAHQRQPAYRDIVVALVQFHRDAGEQQAAAAWARKLVQIAPDDVGAQRLLQSLEQ